MQVTIDRIEGELAVLELEDGSTINIPARLFPTDIAEGQIYNICIFRDLDAEIARQNRINALMNELFD